MAHGTQTGKAVRKCATARNQNRRSEGGRPMGKTMRPPPRKLLARWEGHPGPRPAGKRAETARSNLWRHPRTGTPGPPRHYGRIGKPGTANPGCDARQGKPNENGENNPRTRPLPKANTPQGPGRTSCCQRKSRTRPKPFPTPRPATRRGARRGGPPAWPRPPTGSRAAARSPPTGRERARARRRERRRGGRWLRRG